MALFVNAHTIFQAQSFLGATRVANLYPNASMSVADGRVDAWIRRSSTPAVALETCRIDVNDWIVVDISIESRTIGKSDRIFAQKAPCRGVIVSGAVVPQSSFWVIIPPGVLERINNAPGRGCGISERIINVCVCDGTC